MARARACISNSPRHAKRGEGGTQRVSVGKVRGTWAVLAGILFTVPSPALTDPIAVTATSLPSFALAHGQTTFGPLEWRGGLQLTSEDARFGGLSGVALSGDGTSLLAESDRGYWFRARLLYEKGQLAGIERAEMAPILDSSGKPGKNKSAVDAEALGLWTPGLVDGKVIVGFESTPRAGLYDLKRDGLAARFADLMLPKDAAKGPPNQELEAIGRLPSGSLIAISESNRDQSGNIRAWIWNAASSFAFTLKPFEDYAITDLAVLADGGVLTLERSFGASLLPGFAIRRIPASDLRDGAIADPALLFSGRAPFYAIDNIEGLAVSTSGNGETRITLVSDDNYNRRIQRTLILQFALKP
jgi:hypothetical protein